MLRIRLTRKGKKNNPTYRIVVAEHTKPVKGKFIEILGNYNPTANPKAINIKEDRVREWLKKGAKPSGAVAKLFEKVLPKEVLEEFGITKVLAVLRAKPKREPKQKGEAPSELVATQKGEQVKPVVAAPSEDKTAKATEEDQPADPKNEKGEQVSVEEAPTDEVKVEEANDAQPNQENTEKSGDNKANTDEPSEKSAEKENEKENEGQEAETAA